jgi:hypothetical protein
MMTVRYLNESDYEDFLVGWWKDWGWTPPPKDILPEGLFGMCVMDDDTPVCAGFIYTTNSKAAIVDWIISNKHYRKKPNRKEALIRLINVMTQYAKLAGAGYVYAIIKHPSLIDTYEQCGYNKSDGGMTEMLYKV